MRWSLARKLKPIIDRNSCDLSGATDLWWWLNKALGTHFILAQVAVAYYIAKG